MRFARPFLLVLAVLAAACGESTSVNSGDGDGVGAPTTASLVGRTFWSTSVAADGTSVTLVAGTRVQLGFHDDGRLTVTAGCNSGGGSFEIDAGRLVVGEDGFAITEMGCEPDRQRQDELMIAILTESPTITVEGDTLRLAGAIYTTEFVDREAADPDRALVGTDWIATGFIEGEAASNQAIETPGRIRFESDSALTGFDGCNEFSVNIEHSDGSTGGPVDGDGEIQFGSDIVKDGAFCEDMNDYVGQFHRMFGTGEASYRIDGPNLTMLATDGNGVTFRAADA